MSAGDGKVVMFRPRRRPEPKSEEAASSLPSRQRFPVEIRGNVTFGRLMSGLATVGLTVRVDAYSGRVVITDVLIDD